MTSNLLFGKSPAIVDIPGWVPVDRIRWGRTKLLAGSRAPSRGRQSRPHSVHRFATDSVFILQHTDLPFKPLSAVPLQPYAYDATGVQQAAA